VCCGIYAVVILVDTGSVLYGSLCLAAGATVIGFAGYRWTKRDFVSYGVALQALVGMAGLASLASLAPADLASEIGYPLATYWWGFLLYPLLGFQLSRIASLGHPRGPFESVHRFSPADVVPSSACSLEEIALPASASGRTEVRLFHLRNVAFSHWILLRQTGLRGENVSCAASLQLDCTIAGKGTFFSKALQDALVGTQDWRWHQAPCYLRVQEACHELEVKLIFEGSGQVVIQETELLLASL
jgi:hypothetical protein